MSVYLDYNASAPIEDEVLNKMIDVYRNTIGNPDSRTHNFGDNARIVVENARRQVASLLSVDPTEVYFTSGATESNNIAIQGLVEYGLSTNKKHVITTAIEHKAVLETVKHLASIGFDVDIVLPDSSGRIDANEVISKVRPDTLLVSVMHVNNETGIIQPVDIIGQELQSKNVFFHVDATQSCGKLVDEIKALKYNMLSFSSHKMGGPQGVGALVLRKRSGKRIPVKPILFGGQQENGLRPGTVPVALVAGCGEACRIAESTYKQASAQNKAIKEMILSILQASGLNYELIGNQRHCIDSTINVALKGVISEALMLSTKEYCGISNGSACTSKNYSPSYVLKAMGLSEELINCCIRISWGHDSSIDEIQRNFSNLINIAYNMVN